MPALNGKMAPVALLTRGALKTAAMDTPKSSDKQGKLILEQVNAQLLSAITASNTSLMGKMEEIKVNIGLLPHDMQHVRERVTEAESRISTLEDGCGRETNIFLVPKSS